MYNAGSNAAGPMSDRDSAIAMGARSPATPGFRIDYRVLVEFSKCTG